MHQFSASRPSVQCAIFDLFHMYLWVREPTEFKQSSNLAKIILAYAPIFCIRALCATGLQRLLDHNKTIQKMIIFVLKCQVRICICVDAGSSLVCFVGKRLI